MGILIKGALVDGERKDILIEGNRIERIAPEISGAHEVIEAEGLLAVPSFVNGHTHAAMTLLRGYADDMPLRRWLQEKIWPIEAQMTEEDVYWGTKLACLEMIKTGTTFFNDMYWHWRGVARAVEEMGIRAAVSAVFIDLFDPSKTREQIRLNERLLEESSSFSSRVIFTLGPHAIYTVSEEGLKWCARFAEENGLLVHIHLSETQEEVQYCLKEHGVRPVRYLERIGFLGPEVVAAHCVWLDEEEMEILRDHGVKVVHNPVSNMKLAVGDVFPYRELRERGITLSLGTDGPSSNNNLDLLESVKFAALLQKHHLRDPEALQAEEALGLITWEGAEAFGLGCGRLQEGRWADIALLDLKAPPLVPHFHEASDLVYAADGSCVDTLICDGRILMRGRRVEGEEEIVEEARRVAYQLVARAKG